MKRKSQLLALLMALCLIVSVLSVPAWAEEETGDGTAAGDTSGTEQKPDDTTGGGTEQKPDDTTGGSTEQKPDDTTGGSTEQKPNDTTSGTEQKPNDTASEEEEQKRKEEEEQKRKEEEEQKRKEEEEKKKKEEEEKKKQEEAAAKTISISISSVDVSLGKITKGETSSSVLGKSITITNKGTKAVTLSRTEPTDFTMRSLPSRLAAGESCTVSLALVNANNSRNYSGKFVLTAAIEGDNTVAPSTYSISISAEVVEPSDTLTIDTSSKDFGKLKVGYDSKTAKEKEITVKITNKGSSTVQMNVPKGNDHFTVSLGSDSNEWIGAGKVSEYKVYPKQNLAAGSYTDTITFQTKSGISVTLKATLVVEKVQDPITLEPATVDFGTVEEGYSQPTAKTVTVRNNLDSAIRVDAPYSTSYEIGALSNSSVPAGGTATFTIRPSAGLPANNYNGALVVQAGNERAVLEVKFTVNKGSGSATAFSDVAANSTFAADIAYVNQNGLMSGKGSGTFKPQDPITRGQLVTILHRLDGKPVVEGKGFSDVAAGSYCESAVKWASAVGVTTGNKDGTFNPNAPITRQQLAAFLYRYNTYKNYTVAAKADLGKFSDANAVAASFKDAMAWANGAGLVNGTADGRLNPTGGATRGQAAAILHRYCVSIGK